MMATAWPTPRRPTVPGEIDWSEWDGFQVDGKVTRLQRWRERKEARGFRALCHRLAVRKRYIEIMNEGPGSSRYESLRESGRRWARKHREYETARVRRWRLAKRRAQATVIECNNPECESQWCPVPTRGTGRFARYCCKRCFNRARYLRRLARRVGYDSP
jgi:hypothetical protein